jgi:hypothetical protein
MKTEVSIRLTWSKVMAFLILACSMTLDIVVEKSASTFFIAAPIAAGLIAGKQYFDTRMTIKPQANEKVIYHLDTTQ